MMSIRLRLTLLFSALLAVTLTVFSVLLYLTLSHSTRTFMENTLAYEMDRLSAVSTGSVSVMSTGSERACDGKGNVTGRSENIDKPVFALSSGGLTQVLGGQAVYETLEIDGTTLLVYTKPEIIHGKTTAIVQVARSMSEQQQALDTLRTVLITGSFFTLVVAGTGGWILAGAALRSIDQLTQTAALIGTEGSFYRRVEYTGPQDEVGRLATTFNHMLQALENAYQKVTQSLEAQRAFIADASHELRTPLTTLRGNLALLQREPPISPEDRRAVLADSVDESERMIRLVSDLLTLARVDYAPRLAVEPVTLSSLFAEIHRQRHTFNPDVHFHLKPVRDLDVLAKRDTLKQVLLILLDNAFKFTPSQGQVELSARRQGNVVEIRVKDTGVGITKDQQAHIFQRFFRVDPSRSGNGYGLGLAIAKALVEQQNGRIAVESSPGQGSTFMVSLPLAAQQTVSANPVKMLNLSNAVYRE